MAHSCTGHDSFIRGTWLKFYFYNIFNILRCLCPFRKARDVTHWYMWNLSFTCKTWLIHVRDMTHSYVGHDSFIRGTWLIHTWDMTHSYAGHDSFIRGTWLIHTWDTTHSYLGDILDVVALRVPVSRGLKGVWRDSLRFLKSLLPMWSLTHSYRPRME